MRTPNAQRLPRYLPEPGVYPYEWPDDIDRANEEWGSNCGPGALATMLSLKPDDVRGHIPDFDRKRYTSPTMMLAALTSLGVSMHKSAGGELCCQPECPDCRRLRQFPSYGLARVQFEGPWLNPGVPKVAAYGHTHWVGSMLSDTPIRELWIFDVNGGWLPYWTWRDEIMPQLCKMSSRATMGWHCTHWWSLGIP